MRALWILCALVGCSDDPVETTWKMQLSYDSTSCGMSDDPKLWLLDEGGTFESSFNQGNRRMVVESVSEAGYTVTISEDELSALFQVHLTPRDDGVFTLDGLGTLDRTGSNTCHDTFTLTGTAFPEDVGCGQQEQDCALVYGWEWHPL